MRELTSPTAVSSVFHLDTAGNAADSKVWTVLREANGRLDRVTAIEAGTITVYEILGLGRAILGPKGDVVVEPSCLRRVAFMEKVAGIVATCVPFHCPFCAGQDLRYISTDTWNKEVEEDKERPVSEDLDEYQCHGTCQGRSFYV